jgi:hypothetical protein
MNNNVDIFLPDTTVKLGTLKEKLSDIYGLEVMTKTQKYLCVSAIVVLGGIVLYQYFKDKK